MNDAPQVIAREDGVFGEVVLRRRVRGDGDPVYELIVNGAFLMDTAETSTEQLLADAFLERHPAPAHVLVGGLGLGFTVDRLLTDRRLRRVDVVEIEPLLVGWLRAGLVPEAHAAVSDERVTITETDVAEALGSAVPGSYDGVLLDVDNGPDFLVHESNAGLYRAPALASAARSLTPGGLLAVWSAAPSEPLAAAMRATVGPVSEIIQSVQREGRTMEYHIYLAERLP